MYTHMVRCPPNNRKFFYLGDMAIHFSDHTEKGKW